MSTKTIEVTDELRQYILSVSLREPEILRRLREETASYPNSSMQIAPEQGQFMALLVRMIGAVNTIELGVFTGYSSLWVALALPSHGKLVACDKNPKYVAVAQRYWREARVENRIDLKLGEAIDTLDRLITDGRSGSFDFVFIDADKEMYDAYYERSLKLVRRGGLIAIDNVLWDGEVANPRAADDATQAIRDLNAKLHSDDRIELSLVPIADGLTLAMKR